MASPGVVAPALLLPIPLISILLSLYNWLVHRSTPVKIAVPLLLATLAAVSGGTALSVVCGEPLRVVARVFVNLLHAALSGVSIYALSLSFQTAVFPSPFLRFFLSLAGLLVVCELASAQIPTSPPLLPAVFALVSRGILLALAIATAILSRQRQAAFSAEPDIEKTRTASESSGQTSGRVSSPTQATWPFPGSLASQDQPKRGGCPARKSFPSDLLSSLTSARTHDVDGHGYEIFAILHAALNFTAGISVDGSVGHTNPHILLASATCTLLWSLMILVTNQVIPTAPGPYSSERQVGTGHKQRPFGSSRGRLSRNNPGTRAQKPSLSRRESDSVLDFLSLRDPFASSPPPPPPLPPVGLGLDEVDVGWNGNKEIGMQYRFPAPRSIVRGGRHKGKTVRVNGKKRLVHQDSARALLPVPETRGADTDSSGDRGFGDEARLAELLLRSLSEEGEDGDSPGVSTPVPTVQPPQVAYVQQTSRWSTSTTVQSIMSASISNRSGVSTYTTCASEKIPTSRISMNTIASALGSRKSSEARRKSAMTASSSKG